jgi:hypothetical protein
MSFVNSVKQYLNNNPSATDSDLRNYVNSLEKSDDSQCVPTNNTRTHTSASANTSANTHTSANSQTHNSSLDCVDPFRSQIRLFNPFSSMLSNSLNILDRFDRFDHVSRLMDTDFDDFVLTGFDDVKPEPNDKGYSRSKTSYVTYHNGQKKKKTVEVEQRYDEHGNVKMHKRKTIEDGETKRVEDFYPDGTKNVKELCAKSAQ